MKKKLFERVYHKWVVLKRRWADKLQVRSETLSLRAKKGCLLFFCLLFASFSIAVVVHAFLSRDKSPVVHATLPSFIQRHDETALPSISTTEFERIEKFKHYIQQLPKTSYDSFMLARPKLLDSIMQIEQYYQSQNK